MLPPRPHQSHSLTPSRSLMPAVTAQKYARPYLFLLALRLLFPILHHEEFFRFTSYFYSFLFYLIFLVFHLCSITWHNSRLASPFRNFSVVLDFFFLFAIRRVRSGVFLFFRIFFLFVLIFPMSFFLFFSFQFTFHCFLHLCFPFYFKFFVMSFVLVFFHFVFLQIGKLPGYHTLLHYFLPRR
jgi:hypothetical protein